MHYYLLFHVHNALANFNKTWHVKNLLVYPSKKVTYLKYISYE